MRAIKSGIRAFYKELPKGQSSFLASKLVYIERITAVDVDQVNSIKKELNNLRWDVPREKEKLVVDAFLQSAVANSQMERQKLLNTYKPSFATFVGVMITTSPFLPCLVCNCCAATKALLVLPFALGAPYVFQYMNRAYNYEVALTREKTVKFVCGVLENKK